MPTHENNSRDKLSKKTYDQVIDRARSARNSQKSDTDPRTPKEGYLGIDDLDRMRRRNIK